MASDTSSQTGKPAMSDAELIAYVKKELDADDERHAQVSAASAGVLPRESQTGVTLDLSHKNIGAIPVGMITLIKDQVERIALSHNPRITLPVEIGQCDRLRYLNLRWNKLKQFPPAIFTLSKLEILDISRNAIEVVPEDIKKMGNLKFLAIVRNQIKRLPLALGEMNLVKLKFDENPIEFPPLDMLKTSNEQAESMQESERDKEICQQVKRFMKAAALRERLKTNLEEESGHEKDMETPRPPRRSNTGGRFPVRPSIGGIDQMFPDARASSSPPSATPPIPQRAHARIAPPTMPSLPRPGVPPLLTGNLDASRARSETVASSTSVRSRRQGYVPRKTSSNLGSVSEASSYSSYSRNIPTPLLTPSHSRANSSASGLTFLDVGSGGDSSSAAVSPIEGPFSARSASARKLSSLPESRNSTQPTINSIKAVKRVLYLLFYTCRPIADVAHQLKGGSPHRSDLGRQIATANAHVEELDRLITCVNGIIEENAELDPFLLTSIMKTTINALQSYVLIVRDFGRKQQRALHFVDPFHIRCLLNVAYSTNIEARNVCRILGFETRSRISKTILRVPDASNSRTVTPTQAKYPKNRKARGPTILPNTISAANVRGKAPPVPLYSNGMHSQANRMDAMTSLVGAPPRSDTLVSMSRSNTMRSVTTESESDESPERGFSKLKACCELSNRTLPPIRNELAARRLAAESVGYPQAAHLFALANDKCETTIATASQLLNRLRLMRTNDPARIFPELESMFKWFSKDWTDFAEAFRTLTREQPNLGHMKSALRPVHAAVKDVAKILLQSTARRAGGGMQAPASYSSAVRVTPLGAALGPAVQATVVNNAAHMQPEYSQQQPPFSARLGHDRTDGFNQSYGYRSRLPEGR